MKLKNFAPIVGLMDSIKIFKEKWQFVLQAVISDLFFLFLYGFVWGGIGFKIQEYSVAVAGLIQKKSSLLVKGQFGTSLIDLIKQDSLIKFYLNKLILLIIILAVFTYIMYCIFQSFSWRMADIFSEIPFYKYMLQFGILNIFWFFLISVYYALFAFFDFSLTLMQRLGNIPSKAPLILLNIFLGVALYFAFISYPLIGKFGILKIIRKTFSIGVLKIKKIMPMYLVVVIILMVLNYFLALFFMLHVKAMIVAGIVIALPVVSLIRIYIIKVVNGCL